jgi:hypothetical protein
MFKIILLNSLLQRGSAGRRLAVVDINPLSNVWSAVSLDGGHLKLSVLTRMSGVAANPDVRRNYPVIACPGLADEWIRPGGEISTLMTKERLSAIRTRVGDLGATGGRSYARVAPDDAGPPLRSRRENGSRLGTVAAPFGCPGVPSPRGTPQ